MLLEEWVTGVGGVGVEEREGEAPTWVIEWMMVPGFQMRSQHPKQAGVGEWHTDPGLCCPSFWEMPRDA